MTAPIPNLLPVLNTIMPPPPPPPPSAISPMTIETANAAASAEALKEEKAKKRKVLLEERRKELQMLKLRELRKKVRAQGGGGEGPGSSRERNNKFDFFSSFYGRDPSGRTLGQMMERRVQIMQAAAAAQPNYDHGATIATTTAAALGNQPNFFYDFFYDLFTQRRD